MVSSILRLLAACLLFVSLVALLHVPSANALELEGRHNGRRTSHNAMAARKKSKRSNRCKAKSSSMPATSAPTPTFSTDTDAETKTGSASASATDAYTPKNNIHVETSTSTPDPTTSADTTSETGNASTETVNTTTKTDGNTNTDAPSPTPSTSSEDSATSESASATETSTSAMATTTSSSSSVTKAGNAWALGDSVDMSNWIATGGTPWYYTWSGQPVTGAAELGFEFVPQLWGWNIVNEWQSLVATTFSAKSTSTSKYLLGCNEPNEPGQSNMDFNSGVSLWKTYMEPFAAQGYQLGSCSTSSNPNGLEWVKNFMDACGSDCTVHFIPLHWYDISLDAFKEYVESWHNTFNLPIWVTEWACQNFNDANDQCTGEEIENFLKQSVQWLDQQDYVHRYAWFGEMTDMSGVNQLDSLMNSDGTPNDLGKWYLGDHSST